MFWVAVEALGQGSERAGGSEFLCACPELEMLWPIPQEKASSRWLHGSGTRNVDQIVIHMLVVPKERKETTQEECTKGIKTYEASGSTYSEEVDRERRAF